MPERAHSSAERSQADTNDVCAKRPAFGVIAGQEFHCAQTVIFVLPVWFNVVLSVHTFSLVESAFSRIRRRDSPCEQLHSAGFRLHRTTDYATVVLPLGRLSNDLEVVRLL